MKYVIVESGGKQYKASEGDVLEVERLKAQPGEGYTFKKVLLYTADGVCKIGQPQLSGITVAGKIIDHVRGEKIRVAKFKAKAKYRRVTGHRQALTRVKVEQILFAKNEKTTAESKETKKVVKSKSGTAN